MKTCKNCKSPFLQLELSSVVRFHAIADVFRFLILLGPMLSLFFGCTNIHPMQPQLVIGVNKYASADFILYKANRSSMSMMEERMLANVAIKCKKEYREYLPAIWEDARGTLMKGLYLQGIALVLPATSASCFLMFHKKDLTSSLIALAHFGFEVFSIIASFFGSYFMSDARLCFLSNFSTTLSIPILSWFLNVSFSLLFKVGLLYCLELYLRSYCKSVTNNNSSGQQHLTPYDELKIYLLELNSLHVTPKIKIDIPEDPSMRDWSFVNSTIKKILHDIRLQLAELHRDDPMVQNLLKSGKLRAHATRHPRRTESSTSVGTMGGPSVMKIAQMMSSKNAEYKLLKHHQHHGTRKKSDQKGKDDVDVILPEPDLRNDKYDM